MRKLLRRCVIAAITRYPGDVHMHELGNTFDGDPMVVLAKNAHRCCNATEYIR